MCSHIAFFLILIRQQTLEFAARSYCPFGVDIKILPHSGAHGSGEILHRPLCSSLVSVDKVNIQGPRVEQFPHSWDGGEPAFSHGLDYESLQQHHSELLITSRNQTDHTIVLVMTLNKLEKSIKFLFVIVVVQFIEFIKH